MQGAAGLAPIADPAAIDGAPAASGASRLWTALVVLVLLASCAARLIGLGALQGPVFDEHYYVPDARAYLHGDIGPGSAASWKPKALRSLAHPPLGTLSIAAGIAIAGDSPFGWRVTSALAGVLLLAFVYPTGRRLGLRAPWAFVALLLAAADPLLIAQSRVAMLDTFLALWTAASIYLALRYAQSGRAWPWLWLCALSVGASLATKWSGALTLLAVLIVLVVASRERHPAQLARYAGLLVGVTVGVYLLAYAPYFAAGHGPTDWLAYQRHMLTYGWTVQSHASNASTPASWIFDLDPLWYRWSLTNQGVQGFVAIGNPLVWWGAVAAFAAFSIAAGTRRDRSALVPLLLVAALYLPWLLTHRATYFYYMVPVVPYLAILVALGLQRVVAARAWTRWPAVAYVVLAVALGAAWLPFAMGGHASYTLYQALTWLPSWK
jgi:dolichyl-phosphate-mannose-protein mannosyltransferase